MNTRFFGSQTSVVSIAPWNDSGGSASPFRALAVGNTWQFHLVEQTPTAKDVIYKIDLTADSGSLTGTYCGVTVNETYGSTVKTTRSEGLFCNHAHGNIYDDAVNNQGVSAIYYFRMHTARGLERNFIPCYRKSDNKPGMYDLVTNTFYTNIGTGDFIIGYE